jgi:hypothetical protein
MKTYLIPLSLAAALWLGSNASAAIFVHAGPVHVGIGRPVARSFYAHRPVYFRPTPVVVRPAAPIYRPVLAPAPIVNSSTLQAARELRAARIRNAIHEETQQAVQDALSASQN